MKGACFWDVEQVRWIDVEEPRIASPSDAIVQVDVAGMCGSDLHPFFGREKGLDRGTVMGHEFVGKVIETGSSVKCVTVGDRVYAPFSTNCGVCFYCRTGLTSRCEQGQLFGWRSRGVGLHGGQAERVRVPLADSTLMKVPEGLSDESALLLGDNFSTGFYCADMADLKKSLSTVVIGCGSVGLLAILSAKLLGAKHLIAIDRVEARRHLALSMGADVALSPNDDVEQVVRETSEGRGADSVMELVGLPEAQALAFRLLRPGGILSVIGCHTSPQFAFSPAEAYDKNLTYRTGRCPARHYMQFLTDRVRNGDASIDRMITHRFPASECERAYDIFAHQRDGCIKSVLTFG